MGFLYCLLLYICRTHNNTVLHAIFTSLSLSLSVCGWVGVGRECLCKSRSSTTTTTSSNDLPIIEQVHTASYLILRCTHCPNKWTVQRLNQNI